MNPYSDLPFWLYQVYYKPVAIYHHPRRYIDAQVLFQVVL